MARPDDDDDDDRISDRRSDRPRRASRRDDDDDDDRDSRDVDVRDRGPRQDIPNYLVQSVLCTLFCCLPFGVAAIINAAQVNGKIQSGDYRGAREASARAKQFCWISFGIGLVVNLLVAALQIVAAMNGIR